jgi:SAM-dependent methyltransferase
MDIVDYREVIEKIYDEYFESKRYSSRYPMCNRRSFSYMMNIVKNTPCAKVLDYGCGNGRYSIPLLRNTDTQICLFDISCIAMEQLNDLLNPRDEERILARCKKDGELAEQEYDLIICMFGVLSHIPYRCERLRVLRLFYDKLAKKGKLILSVPNNKRRFIFDQVKYILKRFFRCSETPAVETRDIMYKRKVSDTKKKIFFHLYDKKSIIEDLKEIGFFVKTISAESILPEKMVVSSSFLRRVDAILLKIFPIDLGYGILVIVDKEGT